MLNSEQLINDKSEEFIKLLGERLAFAWRRHKMRLTNKTMNDLGAVSLVNLKTNDIFWCDECNHTPYMRSPKFKVADGECGGNKQVTRIDPGFIALKVFGAVSAMQSNQIAAALLPYKSVIRGRYIAEPYYKKQNFTILHLMAGRQLLNV